MPANEEFNLYYLVSAWLSRCFHSWRFRPLNFLDSLEASDSLNSGPPCSDEGQS